MPNVHTPERGENESFRDYRTRRQVHNLIVKRMLRGIGPGTGPRRLQADSARTWRRAEGKKHGIRQFKKLVRSGALHF